MSKIVYEYEIHSFLCPKQNQENDYQIRLLWRIKNLCMSQCFIHTSFNMNYKLVFYGSNYDSAPDNSEELDESLDFRDSD